MSRVEKNIEVAAPLRSVYNQWTQFEDFPRFMQGVQEVKQLDDRRLHWRATIGGKDQEWDAEIREQTPDEKIIWQSTSGPTNAGMVKFDEMGPSQTRVHLEMSYEPEGAVESIGDSLGMLERQVEGDLERFKEFIESRLTETGAWRGEIENPDAPGGHTRGSMSA
ncbi:MAG: SRPBCC family protein [Dehalococcoidia bacterium]